MLNSENRDEKQQESITILPYNTKFKTINSANEVSILSWNITHKDFIEEYPYGTANDLEWKYRLPRIRSKISQSNSDIICLQEIDKKTFKQDFGEYFNEYFEYESKCNYHSNQKNPNQVIFSQAIMYKSSKFECNYSDYRGRAMILLLTNKLQQQLCIKCDNNKHPCLYHSIFIVTVHLESPRKGKNNEQTRISQLKSILKRIKICVCKILNIDQNNIEKFEENISDLRIIIIGDYNSGYYCGPSQMLLNCNRYKFNEAYQSVLNRRNNKIKFKCHGINQSNSNVRIKYFPTYSAMNNIYSIDLMYYTNGNNNYLKLKSIIKTLPQNVINDLNWDNIVGKRLEQWLKNDKKTNKNGQYNLADFSGLLHLPNVDIPSDHLPIGGLFEFGNICEQRNNGKDICRCCVEYVKVDKKTKKKKKKNKGNISNNEWIYHEMNSF